MKKVISFAVLLFLYTSCIKDEPSKTKSLHLDRVKDQVSLLKSGLDSLERETLSEEILNYINKIKNDSIKNESLFLLSYAHFQNDDSIRFLKINKKTFEESIKLKDTVKIAEAYYDLANFYFLKDKLDSAYKNFNEAQKFYSRMGKDFLSAKMLLYLAYIQKDIHDYTGSEVNSIQAIKVFKPLNKPVYLFSAYNNLGIVYTELEEYEKALSSYNEAEKYLKKLKDNSSDEEILLNNRGLVYFKMGKFQLAENSFNEVLNSPDSRKLYPRLYAMALDNLAYTQFKDNNKSNAIEKSLEALKIRDSIRHTAGVVINKIHLGEYYLNQKDTAIALEYFSSAKQLAEETSNFRDLLSSLLFLSEIEDNKERLDEYIQLNDSLQREERAIRNKFARIRFETDEFIQANEQLTEQKKWMILGFSALALSLILLLIFLKQKSQNRELKLKQEQQDSNEEIYSLLIKSQEKLEEGKNEERKRISRDLHDGILSRFFGIRLNLEHLNNQLDSESLLEREKYIKELKSLEKEIRAVSHQLNNETLGSDLSFLKIIEDLLLQEEQLNIFSGEIIVEEEIEWDKLNPKLKIYLYRIIQEALHNINKHAGATKVKIIFHKNQEDLEIIVIDNGVGFNTEKTTEGMGLKNMKSRIKELNGELFLKSDKNGTQITVNLPIK